MAKQEEILNITTDTFVPAAAAGTGTVTTNGIYLSLSSANSVKAGDYITDATQGEARKVTYVSRNGEYGTIDEAFTSDLSALALTLIDKEEVKIVTLGVAADEGSDTTVDGKTLKSGSSTNFGDTPNKADTGTRYVKPKYIGGSTTGACTVVIERFGN